MRRLVIIIIACFVGFVVDAMSLLALPLSMNGWGSAFSMLATLMSSAAVGPVCRLPELRKPMWIFLLFYAPLIISTLWYPVILVNTFTLYPPAKIWFDIGLSNHTYHIIHLTSLFLFPVEALWVRARFKKRLVPYMSGDLTRK